MTTRVGNAPPLYGWVVNEWMTLNKSVLHVYNFLTGQETLLDLPSWQSPRYILLNEDQVAVVVGPKMNIDATFKLEISTYSLSNFSVLWKTLLFLDGNYANFQDNYHSCGLSCGKFYYQVQGDKYTPYNMETGKFGSSLIETDKLIAIAQTAPDGTPLEYIARDRAKGAFKVVTPLGDWRMPYTIHSARLGVYYLSPSFVVVLENNNVKVLNFLTGTITDISSQIDALYPPVEKIPLNLTEPPFVFLSASEQKRADINIELTQAGGNIYGTIYPLQISGAQKQSALFVLNERELRPLTLTASLYPIASPDGFFAADSLVDGNRFIASSNPVSRIATVGKLKEGPEMFALSYSAAERARINQSLLSSLNEVYPTVLSQLILGYLWE